MDGLEGMEKVDFYTEKAIKFDPNSSKALAIKAIRNHYKNWRLAKEYHEQSKALNPNNAAAHLYFAEYYLYRPNPDIKKYLEEITIAQRLNPFSLLVGENYFWALIINDKLDEAEAYLNETHDLFWDSYKFRLKGTLMAFRNKDWSVDFDMIKKALEKEPENAGLNCDLARYYYGILNDPDSAITFHEKALEIDSTYTYNTIWYYYSLLDAGEFNQAEKLLGSQKFIDILSSYENEATLDMYEWEYHYQKGDYEKAREISKISGLKSIYYIQTLTYAALGEKEKVDSINKRLYWGFGHPAEWRFRRAQVHAKLGERDSMYYYLEKLKYDGDRMMGFTNGSPEFDPYRNEERYKAILRDNYIPVPGE